MKSKLALKAKHGEKDVGINVTDLDVFIHAGPDSPVIVAYDNDGDEQIFTVKKRDLHDFVVDN